MTEDKDLTRCGNNHGTTIGTDRTNGTSLPATADLPPVVRELVDGAPEKFRMPTFIACMAPWGCLATRAVRRVQPRDASGGHRVDGAVHGLHGVPQQMEREGFHLEYGQEVVPQDSTTMAALIYGLRDSFRWKPSVGQIDALFP